MMMSKWIANRTLKHAALYLGEREGEQASLALIAGFQKAVWAEPTKPFWLVRIVKSAGQFLGQAFKQWMWARQLSRARIDPNAKCPGCGATSGEIQFFPTVEIIADGSKGAVIHHCKVCRARWAEKPIVKASGWVIEALPDTTLRDDTPVINKPPALTISEARERKPVYKAG